MSWSVAFRLRRQVRESLWIVPFIGGALGWLLGLASADFGAVDVSARWQYSASTAEAVLAAIVAASVGLVGFVVTVSVLIVQMATGTFSARYMRIFYRDWAFKAVLAVLIEMFDVEALAAECARQKRWSFFFTSAPLNLPGGVASPPNAVCVF